MIEIDGSLGEGGGQILRTALSLSCLVRKPFRIFHIRRGRKKPGLMPQHLACVKALASISHAQVKGAVGGSGEIVFSPEETEPGDYSFDIGTAGSTSLLLQAALPPLAFAGGKSRLTLRGGTHVPFSPPFHFIEQVFLPAVKGLGIGVHASIARYGFYPKGGGEIRIGIEPASGIGALHVFERAEIERITGVSGVVNLPEEIAARQRSAALGVLSDNGLTADIRLLQGEAFGRGTFVFLKTDAGACHGGFSAMGERGKRAEVVGEEAARDLLAYHGTQACLDPYLADQIVLYLAVANGESTFTTSRVSRHLLTNLAVIAMFLGAKYRLEGEEGRPGTVALSP